MNEAIVNMGVKEFQFERMLDPLGDRIVKEVPLPPMRPLNMTQVYP